MLARATAVLARGTTALARGTTALARGTTALARGTTALARGTTALARGTTALARGTTALVAGEAKRGKSTLVNAFLGQPVLPVGVTPLTAVAITVRYGDSPLAEVRFANGHEERHPYAALDDLVTEVGNPANRRGIAVTVYVDAPILAGRRGAGRHARDRFGVRLGH